MTPKYTIGQLTIESEAIKHVDVYRWTITGESIDQVEDTSNKIITKADKAGSSAAFTAPVQIDDKNNSQHGWYRSIGFTSDNPSIDAKSLISKEKQK